MVLLEDYKYLKPRDCGLDGHLPQYPSSILLWPLGDHDMNPWSPLTHLRVKDTGFTGFHSPGRLRSLE
jgi:hypothetical protein